MEFQIENGVLKKYRVEPGVTDVVIPDSVTSIGNCAFEECSRLTSVTIPDSVTSIGSRAFDGCRSLTSVTIPDSVTNIGDKAFFCCRSLTSVTIPDRVTSIGVMAFYECKKLTSVTIPDSVTSIGYRAFWGCSSLKSVTIPDSVISIGKDAFSGCSSLTSVTIPDSVTSIGIDAFVDCTSLTTVIFGGMCIPLPTEQKKVSVGEMTNLIFQKDFAMKMDHDVKYAVVAELFRAGYDEEVVFAYVKKNFAKFFVYLLKTGDADTVQKICDNGKLLTKRNIDKYIQAAHDAGQHEIQTMLLNYKNEHFGFDDPLKNVKL